MPFKCVIFDASGTILDDLYVVWKANSAAYHALGFDEFETLEEFRKNFKLPVPEFHRANGIPSELIQQVDAKFREFYPRYASRVTIFPGVKDVLHGLREKKVLLGIASNIPTLFLREHLNEFEIESYFGAITGQEDCDEQKPSPKPVLVTLEKLGVKPPEAMFVGDMEEDIIAGKRANIYTVAISRKESYHPRWRLERQNPDCIISDLGELLALIQQVCTE
ncbi:HAD family hydrolase [Chloroflexota bacterium]